VSVEDEDQWKLLIDLHVDGVLGYGVGRPEDI
jgi:EAL domain-containing protein (putative c-di-GMP-specific phosphodiesterase class I)